MKNKIQLVLCILASFLFVFSGANKIFHFITPDPKDMSEKMVKMSQAMMEINWLMPLLAIVEIGAGILLVIKKFRPLAAIMLLPISIGILLTHALAEPKGLPIAVFIMAVITWVIIDNREKYLPMIR